MPVAKPEIVVNGVNVANGVLYLINWDKTRGLLEAAAKNQGGVKRTMDGPFKTHAGEMQVPPRRFVIEGQIIRQGGFLSKFEAEEQLARIFAGSPAKVRMGSLYLEATFGAPEVLEDEWTRTNEAVSYRVDGEAVPGTFFGEYGFAVGVDQGIPVVDDRVDNSSLKFYASNGRYEFNCPGTAATFAKVAVYHSASTNKTMYLRGKGGRRIPINMDADGNGRIDEAHGFILYPGKQVLWFEDEAGTPASGLTLINLNGTRFRFLGNQSNRYSQTVPLVHHRTGSASYVGTDGNIKTNGDGVSRFGLPFTIRRNLFNNSVFNGTSGWTVTNSATLAVAYPASLPAGYPPGVGDGIGNACKMTLTTYAGNLAVDITLNAGDTVTLSGWIYRPSSASGGVWKVAIANSAYSVESFVEFNEMDRWVYKSVTHTAATAGTYRLWFGSTGGAAAGNYILIAQPQWEKASAASAYQATNTSGVDVGKSTNGPGFIVEGGTFNAFRTDWNDPDVTVAVETVNGRTSTTVYKLDSSTNVTYEDFQTGKRYPVGATETWTLSWWAKGNAEPIYDWLTFDSGGVSTGRATYTWLSRPQINTSTYGFYSVRLTFPASTASCEFFRWFYDATDDTGWGTFALVQAENHVFPTTWVEPQTYRYADLVTLATGHNLLKQSERLSDSNTWLRYTGATVNANTGTSPDGTATGDNIIKGASTFVAVGQDVVVSKGGTYTFSVFLRAGSLTRAAIRVMNQTTGGVEVGVLQIADLVSGTSGWKRYVITTAGTINAGDTLRCYIYAGQTADSTAGDIYAFGAQLVEGVHPGDYCRTDDSPVLPSSNPALDPVWCQNGYLEFDYVWGAGSYPTNGKTFTFLGNGANLSPLGVWKYTADGRLFVERGFTVNGVANSTIGNRLFASPAAWLFDGRKVKWRMEWTNYLLDGVRMMTLRFYIGGTLWAEGNFAALYGSTAWVVPDVAKLISDGNTYGVFSNITWGYPSIPDNAVLDRYSMGLAS